MLFPLVAAGGLATVIFYIVVMSSSPSIRLAAMDVRGGAFVAPSRKIVLVAQIAYLAAVTATLAYSTIRAVTTDHDVWGRMLPGLLVLALSVARLRPAIRITPTGVRLDHRVKRWDELAAGRSASRYARLWPALPRFRQVLADPAFVGAVVDYYLDVPEARASIGTPDGYTRMRHAIGAARTQL